MEMPHAACRTPHAVPHAEAACRRPRFSNAQNYFLFADTASADYSIFADAEYVNFLLFENTVFANYFLFADTYET